MTDEIFPAAIDDAWEPHRQIGERLECDEYLVRDCFRGLGVPEWESPAHLDKVRKATHSLNEAARHADNLLRAMHRLSQPERESLIVSGAVTFHQIEFLRDILSGDATDLKTWLSKRKRGGGRNPAAYIVAEGMRRLFRRLRRPITFGIHSEGGPSTDFGRAVEYAIGVFGIHADWRRPAEKAAGKQNGIKARLAMCRFYKQQVERLKNPEANPDMSGIDIRAENVEGHRAYVISLTEHPEIPQLRIDLRNVPNGRDVIEIAHNWATSVRAAMT